ncbi:MAG: tetratricopeptide repeat protein [Helicobacter sp.]|nr:tetratricopeptide repeat protein [Helicobacter sp.]
MARLSIALIVLCTFSAFAVLNAEPSAFQLQSGATKNEINSLQNKNKTLQKIISGLQGQVNSAEQTQDGLKSLIEGQNSINKKNQDDIQSLKQISLELQSSVSISKDKLTRQENQIKDLINRINDQEIKINKIQQSLQEMNKIMTDNNASIVQQLSLISEFLEKRQKDRLNEKIDTPPVVTQAPKPKIDPKKSPEQIYNDAKEFIRKRDYANAEEALNALIKQNYQSANVYFLLGDIAYRKKDYPLAINYYSQSATLNEDANYMPVLLWRTAWSFRYQKNEASYKKFIDVLIDKYPNSEQGKRAAQDRIIESRNKKDSQS